MEPRPLPPLWELGKHQPSKEDIATASAWMARKEARKAMRTQKARTGAHIPMGKSKKYKVIPTD